MNYTKQHIIRSALLGLAVMALSACGHKNPLINEETIDQFKGNFFLESSVFLIQECAGFYSQSTNTQPALKEKCDRWTADYYKGLINAGSIPSQTTLQNFRDPQFWQAVKPHA